MLKAALANRPDPADAGFGIYLHWPFCASKCPYCDFNSHVRNGGIDTTRFRDAYLTELDWYARLAGERQVTSIFFGGGTPSLMEPAILTAILDKIAAAWPLSDNLEVTLEANPSSVEAGRFRDYRAAGVNRLSL
ncbi:MAG: radical SAM protein, partial [Hyphomicrobiales bacterium]|nr:radical SAM protein [Hyphomicrobiales bacterium]